MIKNHSCCLLELIFVSGGSRYFKVVFLLGGTIGNISWLMFVTLVHPRDEPLDRDFQCLRYIVNPHYREWDAKRRLGLYVNSFVFLSPILFDRSLNSVLTTYVYLGLGLS